MALVKVWNDNVHAHKERFKNEMIEIPAGSYVEMEWEDAVDFKGQFTGVAPTGADGKPDARFFKKIRVERPLEHKAKDMSLLCHADGSEAGSVTELKAKLALYEDRLLRPESSADDDLKETVRKQQEQIAFLMDQLKPKDQRGPGRPRKEA